MEGTGRKRGRVRGAEGESAGRATTWRWPGMIRGYPTGYDGAGASPGFEVRSAATRRESK
jgi:hypothetical protein